MVARQAGRYKAGPYGLWVPCSTFRVPRPFDIGNVGATLVVARRRGRHEAGPYGVYGRRDLQILVTRTSAATRTRLRITSTH